ncbi:F-box/FBD/LRR-repeat protein At1g13570-like [Solanum tuberosum]|uniref:F-box/FBD/LRR-repeat protein At1g13570-like n=1 Tax=Solanum tuberosum TaxID=4113 RepID=UPI000739FC9E|nr:PREDICTED: F-box/FBD/LRR-repeat protein At1g13570-like [Solanum tuberosum]
MTQQAPSKRVVVEGEKEDIIIALPRNVVDRILELLPVHDAARTSILSSKWRDIWVSLPYLVLNNYFCKKLTAKSTIVFKITIDEILLQHVGDIVKFVLDVSRINLSSYASINRWMRYVTRNGVKELTINMSDNRTYILPSSVFNCPAFTRLELFNCVFKPSNSFLGFQNLTYLHLERITFVPTNQFCVIDVPLLVDLVLMFCCGTQYLKMVSPQLGSLVVLVGHYLMLNCFMNCNKLILLVIELEKVEDNPKHDEISTLERFLFSFGSLEQLYLGSLVLEFLNANIVLDELSSKLNCLWCLHLGVDFNKVDQTCCTPQLIKSFPNLRKLLITVKGSDDNVETIMKYLETQTCLNRPLNKLKYVTISSFKCSKTKCFL